MNDIGAVALAGGPSKPKVGEFGKEGSRNTALAERINQVGNKVGQYEDGGQRSQRCRKLGTGDRVENAHDAVEGNKLEEGPNLSTPWRKNIL